MASATDLQNPNLGESDHPQQQVMSSPNATAVNSMSGGPVVRGPEGQGVASGALDMDGETVAPNVRPAGIPQVLMPEAGQSTPLVLNGTTTRRIPVEAAQTNPRYPEDVGSMERTNQTDTDGRDQPIGLMGGLQRVVQAVENAVQLSGTRLSASPMNQDAVEYASVKSSVSPERQPPSASALPETPLFSEATLVRMRQMETSAPLLYSRSEHPTGGPPSTSSSDIQNEVRRQLAALLAERDEEGRRLRSQVEALAYENSELRKRVYDDVHRRQVDTDVGTASPTFPRFGWLSRGIGSLIGSGTSMRALDFRPGSTPDIGLGLAPPASSIMDFGLQNPQSSTSLPQSGQVTLSAHQVPNAGQVPLQVHQVQSGQVPSQAHQVPNAGQVPLQVHQVQSGQVPSQTHQVPQSGQVLLQAHQVQSGQVPSQTHQVPQSGQVLLQAHQVQSGQVPSQTHQVLQSGQVPSQTHQVLQSGQVPSQTHQVLQSGQEPTQSHQVPPLGQVPTQVPQVGEQPPSSSGLGLDPLSVVLTGMAQLQGLMTDIATSPKAAARPEVIKPGVTSLPDLPPLGNDACLAFSDGLHNAKPALSDVSDNSEELWNMVVNEATSWYGSYLKLDPLGRLVSKPEPSSELAQAKWQRLSRRIETMILQATPATVKEEISSARVSGLLPLMCKLFVVYGPGSLNEREIGLRNIQDPPAGTSVQDTIEHLRKWKRWCSRMSELGGVLPDCALQVKALSKISKAVLAQNPEISFRVSLSRASLQIDNNPDNEKVLKLHAQILSELEAIHHRVPKDKESSEKDKAKDSAAQAKVKGVEASTTADTSSPKAPKAPKAPSKAPPPPPKVKQGADPPPSKTPCTFFRQSGGCKKGADCTFGHDWSSLSQAEKSSRCKVCGSKNHRAADCRAGIKDDRDRVNPKGTPRNSVPKTAPEVPAPPPKPASQQHIKSMLADAARILQQAMPDGSSPETPIVQAVPISSPCPQPGGVNNNQPPAQAQGSPVTLASLSAQLEMLRGMSREPEIRGVSYDDTVEKAGSPEGVGLGSGTLQDEIALCESRILAFQPTGDDDRRIAKALALLDSGATHAVVPFSPELGELQRVPVTLAGDSKQEWLKTKGGTLVVPPLKASHGGKGNPQTIVPLGSLVETLGCSLTWSKRKGLRITHPSLGVLRTDLSNNHCPLLQEDQAMTLISELEARRLEDFKERVQDLECQIESIDSPPDPTHTLRKCALSGDRKDVLQAIFAQPYLASVQEEVKARLAEGFGDVSDETGQWLLKNLPLNRATRRTLLQTKRWLVHLCSGPEVKEDPISSFCEKRGVAQLNVDLRQKGGKGWDLNQRNGVWRLLLWAAASGRIAAILASPPNPKGKEATVLRVQDMFLWSLASVANGQGVPYLCSGVCQQEEHREKFAQWAGMQFVSFSQGSLGGEFEQRTEVMTNLDIGLLSRLPTKGKPGRSPEGQVWIKEFRAQIVRALMGSPAGATCEGLDNMIRQASPRGEASPRRVAFVQGDNEGIEDEVVAKEVKPDELEAWKQHVLRGHLPYRRDCQRCIEGSGLGIQHRRVKYKTLFSLSVDLFGPLSKDEKGLDEESVSANPHIKYGLVGAFRVPRKAFQEHGKACEDKSRNGEPEDDDPLKDVDFDGYEPSIEGKDDLLQQCDIRVDDAKEGSPQHPSIPAGTIDPEVKAAEDVSGPLFPEADCHLWKDEDLPKTKEELEAYIEYLATPPDQVVLRYFVGLKSKTGAEVAAGLQRMIMQVNKLFPVRVLHTDPGTEFTSDALKKWLLQNNIALQHPLPADKQANGLAERTIGWVKARARTLIGSSGLSVNLWPLAMRWAVSAHNRQVLSLSTIPYFGQVVLHKLKRPPGGSNELMPKWIKAKYLAPHLSVPEGHVLVTEEGNLVGSKGFRMNTIDPEALPELVVPIPVEDAQEEEGPMPLPVPIEAMSSRSRPDRRIRMKSSVRAVEKRDGHLENPETLSGYAMLNNDFSNQIFRRIVSALMTHVHPSQDRRGRFEGRFVFGTYCHGGNRGVVSLSKKMPETTRFLNSFLRRRLGGSTKEREAGWSALMVMQATEIGVHKDVRNEWYSKNYVLCVPGSLELHLEEHPGYRKEGSGKPESSVRPLIDKVVEFDARKPHSVSRSPDWFIVGYSPLGTAKLPEEMHHLLYDLGFRYRGQDCDLHRVNMIQKEEDDQSLPDEEFIRDSRGDVFLEQDEQPDSYTPIVGWDPTGGNQGNVPVQNLEETDLYQFLVEREVPWLYRRLREVGVEEAADLPFLFEEDFIELGIPRSDAQRVLRGIHPEGTRRPDAPDLSALRTGEVRIIDREQRQIPWVIQNRTLFNDNPGLPLEALGIGAVAQVRNHDQLGWLDQEEQRIYGEGPPGFASASSSQVPPGFASASSDQVPPGFASASSSQVPPGFASASSDQVPPGFASASSSQVSPGFASASSSQVPPGFASASSDQVPPGFASASSDQVPPGFASASRRPVNEQATKGTAFAVSRGSFPSMQNVDEEYAQHAIYMQELWDQESEEEIEAHDPEENHEVRMVLGPSDSEGMTLSDARGDYANRSTLDPRIGVPLGNPLAVFDQRDAPKDISVKQIDETFYTPDVEKLLSSLSGPLRVVHNVSPSEVKQHLASWTSAAEAEVSALEEMQAIKRYTGEAARELLRSSGVQVLPAKTVFTVKPGSDTAWYRRKCRVVGCGNFETKDPTADLYAGGVPAEVLRICLVQAGAHKLIAWITDIQNAFLLAPLPKESEGKIILRPPRLLVMMNIVEESEVWVINRAMYGLRQSPKWWQEYRDSEFRRAKWAGPGGQTGFRQSSVEPNLWYIIGESDTILGYAIIYVDDIMILSDQPNARAAHDWINTKWKSTPLERATVSTAITFLGVDVHVDSDSSGNSGFALSQAGYIDELLRTYQVQHCPRQIPFPREWTKELPEREVYAVDTLRKAQKITGELLWLSQRSRVDIAYHVALMGSWNVRAPTLVLKLGLRMLEYLWTTRDWRLSLIPRPESEKRIEVFTDASFSPYGSHSVTGVVVLYRGKVVLWKGKRQTLISLSTAEAELISACEGVTIGKSISALLETFVEDLKPMRLYVDDVAAIILAEGGGSHRTRHLRVRANFVKELQEAKALDVIHCPGEIQIADALTKVLPAPRHQMLREMIGLYSVERPEVAAVAETSLRALPQMNQEFQLWLLVILVMMQLPEADAAEEDDEVAEPLSLELSAVAVMLMLSALFVWETIKFCLGRCCRSEDARIQVVQADEDEHATRRQRRQEAVRRAITQEVEGGYLRRRRPDPDEPSASTQIPSAAPLVQVHVNQGTDGVVEAPLPMPRFTGPSRTRLAQPAATNSVVPEAQTTYTNLPSNSSSSNPPSTLPAGGQWTLSGVPSQDGPGLRTRRVDLPATREVSVQTDFPRGLTFDEMHNLQMTTTNSRSPGAVHLFPECQSLRGVSSTSRRSFCKYCLNNAARSGF